MSLLSHPLAKLLLLLLAYLVLETALVRMYYKYRIHTEIFNKVSAFES